MDIDKKIQEIIKISKEKFNASEKELWKLVNALKYDLGESAECFNTYNFDKAALDYFAEQIKSNQADACPFVVLARYVPKAEKARFTKLLFNYGKTNEEQNSWLRLDWSMKATVCSTLPFLHSLPEHSMRYLGKRLHDSGCDDEPFYSATEAMAYFYEHADLIIDDIAACMKNRMYDHSYYFELLSRIITTKSQAQRLLPIFEAQYIKREIADYYQLLSSKELSRTLNGGLEDYENQLIAFYGYLQMLMQYG